MERKFLSLALAKGESVSAVLTTPGVMKRAVPGVIVAHGAGNDMESPLLAAFTDGLAGAGYPALRFNFPYKQKGLKAPDRPEKLEETWLAAFRYFREDAGLNLTKVIAAGKSMGGRIASQMAAEGKLPADGLVFLGYPLHPAGDKTRIRDAHLYRIGVPMLFFAGTRDPLCNLELLKSVLGKLPASWKLDVIEGGDHSFKVPKSMGIRESETFERMVTTTVQWLKVNF